MPSFHVQNIFSGGELSPLMRARADQPAYQNGAREMLNMLPMPQGGCTRRPGMEYLGAAQHAASRLIPFVFSATQGRMLEFGDHTMRVWLPDGTLVTDDEGAVLVVATPFAATDLQDLRYAQSADVMYFAHPDYAPCKVSRYADDNWTFSTLTFLPTIATPTAPTLAIMGTSSSDNTSEIKYLITAIDDDTGAESSPSPASGITAKSLSSTYYIRLTWVAVAGAAEYRVYKYKGGVYGYIGRSRGTTFDDTNIAADGEDTPPEYENPFSGEGNYPSQVFFHQQRLGFASTNAKPITIWLSRTGDFESMASSTPPKDDDSIEVSLASAQANRIVWLKPDRTLLTLGTEGSEYTLEPSTGIVLTPATCSFQMQTSNGGDNIAPLNVGPAVLYVQRGSGAVREFAYNYNADKYLGQDITILSRHVLRDAYIGNWCYQQEPYSVVWMTMSDGALVGLTYMRDQQVVGWHRHATDGNVLDVASMPGTPDDQVWLLVRRSINGQAVVYVERLGVFFDSDELSDAVFADSSLSYLGTPLQSFGGMGHLNGKECVALADGGTVRGLTISSGGFSLPQAAASVCVGLPFTSRLIPSEPEVQTQYGTSMMHNRQVLQIRARIYRSMTFTAGLERGGMRWPITDRNVTDGAFAAVPFFSEGTDLVLDMCAGWSASNALVLEVDTPTPLTLLALTTVLEISPYTGKL